MEQYREKNKFTLWQYPLLISHLEEMAQKGHMLSELDGNELVYDQCEPQKVHFAVTFFPDYDFLDPVPPPALERLWEFCDQNGWQHITDSASMQIFCNERENPVPLHTDAVVQLDNFHRMINAAKLKNWRQEAVINGGFIIFLAVVAGVFIKDTSFSELAGRVSPLALLIASYYTYKCISAVCGLISYYCWYKKANRSARENDIFVTFSPDRVWADIDWAVSLFFLCGMIILLVKNGELGSSIVFSIPFVILFFVIIVSAKLMKKNGVSARYSRRIIWIIAAMFILLFVMALPYIIMTISDRGLGGDMITRTIVYPQ